VKKPELMDNARLDLKKEASELEVGSPHFPCVFALGGALDLLNQIGKRDIERRIYSLGDYLTEGIKRLGLEIISPLDRKYRSGITIIKMEDPGVIVKALYKKNIIVSARGGGLRVSVHIYNNQKEIDIFRSGLAQLLPWQSKGERPSS